jgi:superoxide dismutase, Fe-Mn family
MACNNHIFFSCLSPKKTEPSSTFVSEIEESFSSYDTLRIEMIETADAMFGPGFVWIVKDQDMGKMKLLCTYLAGSPLPGAHFRSQQTDMATHNTSVPSSQRFMSGRDPTNTVGSFGLHSRAGQANQRAPGNYSGQPILCVNTWEHTYLRDYGIGGKRTYLERWWDRIDWAVVERNAKVYGPERHTTYSTISHAFKRKVTPLGQH